MRGAVCGMVAPGNPELAVRHPPQMGPLPVIGRIDVAGVRPEAYRLAVLFVAVVDPVAPVGMAGVLGGPGEEVEYFHE